MKINLVISLKFVDINYLKCIILNIYWGMASEKQIPQFLTISALMSESN